MKRIAPAILRVRRLVHHSKEHVFGALDAASPVGHADINQQLYIAKAALESVTNIIDAMETSQCRF